MQFSETSYNFVPEELIAEMTYSQPNVILSLILVSGIHVILSFIIDYQTYEK